MEITLLNSLFEIFEAYRGLIIWFGSKFKNTPQIPHKSLLVRFISHSLSWVFSSRLSKKEPLSHWFHWKKSGIRLHETHFLIKCQKVQLSGEKCFLGKADCVSRGLINQSRRERAALCADPLSRRAPSGRAGMFDDYQTPARLFDGFPSSWVGGLPVSHCGTAHAGAVVEANFPG